MVGVCAFDAIFSHSVDWILMLSLSCFALDFVSDFPDHAAELTGYGYFDFVVMHESFAQTTRAQVEAVLRCPGDLTDPTR